MENINLIIKVIFLRIKNKTLKKNKKNIKKDLILLIKNDYFYDIVNIVNKYSVINGTNEEESLIAEMKISESLIEYLEKKDIQLNYYEMDLIHTIQLIYKRP